MFDNDFVFYDDRLAKYLIIQLLEKIMANFDQYIQYRVLRFKFSALSDDLPLDLQNHVEHVIDTDQTSLPLRNVCAKVSSTLLDRLENSLSILEISKRKFIEMALIDALDKVDQELLDSDAFEFFRKSQQ